MTSNEIQQQLSIVWPAIRSALINNYTASYFYKWFNRDGFIICEGEFRRFLALTVIASTEPSPSINTCVQTIMRGGVLS